MDTRPVYGDPFRSGESDLNTSDANLWLLGETNKDYVITKQPNVNRPVLKVRELHTFYKWIQQVSYVYWVSAPSTLSDMIGPQTHEVHEWYEGLSFVKEVQQFKSATHIAETSWQIWVISNSPLQRGLRFNV